MREWSRQLQDAVRASNQRALERERDEKAAAADETRCQSITESLLNSQVLPSMDRALTEAQVTESLRQGTKGSLNLLVMAGSLKGTTIAIRTVTEKLSCEVYLYHRLRGIQSVHYVKSGEEAYVAICQGLIRVLNAPAQN
jgi:hypothetical protein